MLPHISCLAIAKLLRFVARHRAGCKWPLKPPLRPSGPETSSILSCGLTGFGRPPSKKFSEAVSSPASCKAGNVPINRLRWTQTNTLRRPVLFGMTSPLGIDLDNSLSCAMKNTRSVKAPTTSGMGPSKLFFSILTLFKFRIEPRPCGMGPRHWLPLTSRKSSRILESRPCGMGPRKWLLLTSRSIN